MLNILKTFVVAVLFVVFAGPVYAQNSTLRILTEISAPATFYLPDGILGGFGVEIVRAVQKEIEDETPIEVMPWARGYRFLLEEPGVILFPTTRTPEREELFDWVGPLMTINWTFYGRAGTKIILVDFEDAKKVNGIGVYRDDVRAKFLQANGFKNLQMVDSQYTNIRKLLRHRIDLLLSSDVGMKGYMLEDEKLRGKIEPVLSFRHVDLYLAFSKGTDPAVLKKWSTAYDKLSREGKIRSIQDRWR